MKSLRMAEYVYCPLCNSKNKIQKTENLPEEPKAIVICENCGSVFTRRNKFAWSLIVDPEKLKKIKAE